MASAKIGISSTRNYRLFQRSADNRALDPVKHKRLMDSMKLYGFLPEFPIVCCRDKDKHLIVKDGQHRLAIAEQLGLPVCWVEESTQWDVALVNSTAKIWRLIDYAQRFASQGNADYQEALDFMSGHSLPIGVSFSLLAGTTTFGNIQAEFMTGAYKIKDRAWADSVASIYGMLSHASKNCRNAACIAACMAVCRVGEFDARRFELSLRRCHDKLVSFSTRDAYLQMMEEIYNFGRKTLFALKNEAIMAMRSRNAAVAASEKKAANGN